MKTKIRLTIAGLILVLFIYISYQCHYAKAVYVDFKSEKIKKPLKITQISDFHSNKLKNTSYLLKNIKDFDPDFIVITGDLNDYYEKKKTARALDFLDELLSLNIKTYYILGNHEEEGPGLDERERELRKRKVSFLKNSGENFNHKEDKIYIYGTGALSFDTKNFLAEDDKLNILLSHFPIYAINNAKGADFIFSGHTHGGQVRLPFFGAIRAPGEGFNPKYVKGSYKLGKTTLYIDSGLGNTGLNLRFLNQVQFSNILIKPEMGV